MDVPITLQSMVILVLPLMMNRHLALGGLILFLIGAFVGMPVLSGGSGGPEHFYGKSGGYLIGFVVVLFLSGYIGAFIKSKLLLSYFMLFIVMHLTLITLGTTWIYALGNSVAIQTHVLPYLPGAILKSGIGAILVWTYNTITSRAE